MATIRELGPVGFNPAGEYDSETLYHRLDVVFYNDTSYVSKQDVIGELPTNTTYWDELGMGGADLSNYYTKSETDAAISVKYSKPSTGIPKTDLDSSVQTSLGKADSALQTHQDISGKQDVLVSGTNIKTINNESLLGSGNITIQGGGGSSEWGSITGNISSQTDLQTALGGKENTTNKVTSLSSASTDTQYPSAKCVYDLIGDISSAIDAINGEVV